LTGGHRPSTVSAESPRTNGETIAARTRRTLIVLAVIAVGVATVTAAVVHTRSGGTVEAPAKPASTGIRDVVLIICDGMGPEHLALGRALNGGSLAIDGVAWGGRGTLDTTSLDGVTDSAAAGTALATGRETHNGWVSMVPGDPGPVSVETVLERAESEGKASGLVTDVYVEDATPAAFAAHVDDRGLSREIADQMVAHDLQFLFGADGGLRTAFGGLAGVTYVDDLRDLRPYLAGARPWPTGMYGFMGTRKLAFDLDRREAGAIGVQPTLPQLTKAALGVLGTHPDGFFLMVEAGAQDWASHARDAAGVGAEIREFDKTVLAALSWARGRDDTLVVVTADHECGGLTVDGATDYGLIRRQRATCEWMWGLISAHAMSVDDTLAKYAGIRLTAAERDLIAADHEMGIADVLAARDHVGWNAGGTRQGEHTDTPVPIMAWGPGAAAFSLHGADNEVAGRLLLDAVSR
jgi:alkaline phosphatase